jgi:hypothetical protein
MRWRDRAEEWLRRGRWVALLALLVVAGVLAYRLGWRDSRLGDTQYYVKGAQLYVDGGDLYWQPGEPRRNTSYTYPPPFAVASTWMLVLPYRVVRLVWLALMLACSGASLWLAWRYARARPPPPAHSALILALTVALVARFWLNDLAHGQSNWLITFLLLAGLCAARSERASHHVAGGCVLALALAIKPTAWLLLPWFLVVQPRPRLVGACLLTLVVVLALPGLRYGPTGYAHQIGDWVELMGAFADRSVLNPGNVSLSSSITRLACGVETGPDQFPAIWGSLPTATVMPWARGLSAVFLLGVGLVLWRRCAHKPEAPAAVLLLGMLLSPVTWKAHLTLLVLPGAVVARGLLADDAGWGSRLAFGAALACLLVGSRGLFGWSSFEHAGGMTLGVLILLGLLVHVLAKPPAEPEETPS